MNNHKTLIIQVVLITMPVLGQGTFDNLDFEQANPVYVNRSVGTVTAASAIPDWTAAIGGVPQSTIVENFFSTGAPEVVLLSQNTLQPPLDGYYSVLLTGSFLVVRHIRVTS
jgi:hypothetical protein